MLLNSIKMQVYVLLRRKAFFITFFLMFFIVLLEYFANIQKYYGKDVMQVYHPIQHLVLNYGTFWGNQFREYFPIIAVIPAAFSFISDQDSKEIVYLQSRQNSKIYYFGKAAAVFITTFLAFFIPLFLETILYHIVLPSNGLTTVLGDSATIYEPNVINEIKNALFPELLIKSPFLHSIIWNAVFSMLTGVLSLFALAVSTFHFMRYKIFVFLPVYILLYILTMLQGVFELPIITVYHMYIMYPMSMTQSKIPFFIFICTITAISLIILLNKARKDTLV